MSLSWRWLMLRKRAVRAVCRTVYRDFSPETGRSMIVAGSARSGTTWLSSLIGSQVPCRVMFEPFHSRMVEEFSSFPYFTYRRPGDDDPALEAFARQILSGQIRHRWIDREVDRLRPRRRLIKEIRANLFLRWLHDRFPEVPVLFVVRHPCAVVLSRMQLGWDTDRDIAPFLEQEALVDDFLRDKIEIIESAQTVEEKHAIIWCVSNLVPRIQFSGSSRALTSVFYENLCVQPQLEIPRLFASAGLEFADDVFTAATRPSTTSREFSAVVTRKDLVHRWQKALDSNQVRRILDVVGAFGLDDLYDAGAMPKADSV